MEKAGEDKRDRITINLIGTTPENVQLLKDIRAEADEYFIRPTQIVRKILLMYFRNKKASKLD